MARKLEDIGLTNSAKQMHETFMQRLDLTDASDDLLVYITGRDDRAYKYYGPYEGNESIASEDVEYYTASFYLLWSLTTAHRLNHSQVCLKIIFLILFHLLSAH